MAFCAEGRYTHSHTRDIKEVPWSDSVSVVPVIGNGEPIRQGRPWQPSRLHNAQHKPYLLQIERPNSAAGRRFGASASLCAISPEILYRRYCWVVSPLTGEGKTTFSVNLALTLARHGEPASWMRPTQEGVAQALGVVAYQGSESAVQDHGG